MPRKIQGRPGTSVTLVSVEYVKGSNDVAVLPMHDSALRGGNRKIISRSHVLQTFVLDVLEDDLL